MKNLKQFDSKENKVETVRVKLQGQGMRYNSETAKLFREELKFMGGMKLRNFDILIEKASDSRMVRRIVEKRMCQAYHRKNKTNPNYRKSNKTRYWMDRATSYQLYNIGQKEEVENVCRDKRTHWKIMYDNHTGKIVHKKKMIYSSLNDANQAVEKWKSKHPSDCPVSAYKCVTCGKWHIGHVIFKQNHKPTKKRYSTRVKSAKYRSILCA